MKNKRRLVTILINTLFIAAIAVVGWKIYDYVSDSRKTTDLAESLWEDAAITAPPVHAIPQPEGATAAGEEPESGPYATVSCFHLLIKSCAL